MRYLPSRLVLWIYLTGMYFGQFPCAVRRGFKYLFLSTRLPRRDSHCDLLDVLRLRRRVVLFKQYNVHLRRRYVFRLWRRCDVLPPRLVPINYQLLRYVSSRILWARRRRKAGLQRGQVFRGRSGRVHRLWGRDVPNDRWPSELYRLLCRNCLQCDGRNNSRDVHPLPRGAVLGPVGVSMHFVLSWLLRRIIWGDNLR